MLSEPREALSRTSTFKVARGNRPVAIDLTTVYEGDLNPLYTKAILELNAVNLRYCIAAPGLPRPATFATKHGDGHKSVWLKRAGGFWRALSVNSQDASHVQ
jgi:hypothetical protein